MGDLPAADQAFQAGIKQSDLEGRLDCNSDPNRPAIFAKNLPYPFTVNGGLMIKSTPLTNT